MPGRESTTVTYREIPGHPGYRVGDDGSVWSRVRKRGQGRGKPPLHFFGEWQKLKPGTQHSGSLSVNLGRNKTRLVARLVLEAFVGQCPPRMEACHFPDRDPSNCRLDNLRWGTSADNTADQRRHSTLIGGERHGMAKLTNAQVEEILLLAGTMTQQAIADRFGIRQPHVSDIINGKKRTASSHAGKGL